MRKYEIPGRDGIPKNHITVWGMSWPLCHMPEGDAARNAATGSITPKQIRYQKRICDDCLAILKMKKVRTPVCDCNGLTGNEDKEWYCNGECHCGACDDHVAKEKE